MENIGEFWAGVCAAPGCGKTEFYRAPTRSEPYICKPCEVKISENVERSLQLERALAAYKKGL